MKVYKVKRLWGKMASVRSYIVDRQIKKGEGLIVELHDPIKPIKKMTLSAEDLKKKRVQFVSKSFDSKINSKQKYKLYDYVFKVDQNEPKPKKKRCLFS